MRFLRNSLVAAVACLCTVSASAQTTEADYQEALKLGYRPYPYWFAQIQGGVGTTFTNKSFTDLISPTASVGFGRFFGSGVGARVDVNAWESKGGFKSIEPTYKFNYVNSNLDLLLNLTNIFSKSNHHLVDVILVGGIGLNYAWGNDDMDAILASTPLPAENTSNAWGKGKSRESLYSHNIRAGLLFDFNVAKNWSIGLEVDANSLSDRFNSKYNNSDDWMLTAQLGVTYKFGFKAPRKPDPIIEKKVVPVVEEKKPEPVEEKKEPEVVPPPVVTPPVVTPPPAPVVEEKIPSIKEAIYYFESKTELDESNSPEAKIKRVADWAKQYPKGKLTVTGYADKGTGYASRNQMLSEKRAQTVAEALKEAGVPASQIVTVEGLGDTIQPFPENNDWNRCVIIEGQ